MTKKISRGRKEQIANRIELIMLSGLILIVISQGIGGICYCLEKYSVSRPEKKVIYDLSVPSDTLYVNRVNGVLTEKCYLNK